MELLVGLLVGFLLGYYLSRSFAKEPDGTMHMVENDGRYTFSLELDEDPLWLKDQKRIIFRVEH